MRHVALVGMMGTGKTVVGRELAKLLKWTFYDCDEQVENASEMSVAQIFAEDGEDGFREWETRISRGLLERSDPAVIAMGGGAVLSAELREVLTALSTVCWLTAEPETLLERVGGETGRPLLSPPENGLAAKADVTLIEVLDSIASNRENLYRKVADVSIATDDLSPTEVARALAEMLSGALAGVAPSGKNR